MSMHKFGYTEERLIEGMKEIQETQEKTAYTKFERLVNNMVVSTKKFVITKLVDEVNRSQREQKSYL